MTLVAVLAPVGVSPRHRAAPALALALSAVRALGAEVEYAAIWRHSPELARGCGGGLQDGCRRGVVEWLSEVEPAATSEKIAKYSADYDAVGVLIWGSGPGLQVSAVVYAPGAASYLGLPPVDATVDIKVSLGDADAESFFDLFLHSYEKYAEFVRRLDRELARPVEVELWGRRARVTPYAFLERVDAAKSLERVQDLYSAVPVFRRDLPASVICDVMHKERKLAHFDTVITYAGQEIAEVIESSFERVGGLLLPKSVDGYGEFIASVRRKIEEVIKGPRRSCAGELW